MEDCYIKNFKGGVSADIPVYNQFAWDIPSNSNVSFSVGLITSGKLMCTGDVEIWNNNSTQKLGDSTTPFVLNNEPDAIYTVRIKSSTNGGKLILEGIYSVVSGVSNGWGTLKPHFDKSVTTFYPWFKGTTFDILSQSGITGTVKEVVDSIPNVTILGINSNTLIGGNISDLIPIKSQLTSLTIGNYTPVNFTLDSLSKLTSLTVLNVMKAPSSGSVEILDFIRGQIAEERTTGSMTVSFAGFTFNGNEGTWTFKSLSWTSTTATLDGVTVDL